MIVKDAAKQKTVFFVRKEHVVAILRDAVYGAAVGDALGVPFEFKARGTFSCTDMVGYGTHHQPAGTFSDDTSMMLATCDSLRVNGGEVDTHDMRERFVRWMDEGAYAVDGIVFDRGITVSRALRRGHGLKGERDNGNGSLMRIVPLAFVDAGRGKIREVSSITHAHKTSTESCVVFVEVARRLASGVPVADTLADAGFDEYEFSSEKPRDLVRSGGYVLDTLDAAFWCLARTKSYSECVLSAVNLGGDTDTTACVAGALAGIVYGYDAIPTTWIETLRGKDLIESCLF